MEQQVTLKDVVSFNIYSQTDGAAQYEALKVAQHLHAEYERTSVLSMPRRGAVALHYMQLKSGFGNDTVIRLEAFARGLYQIAS